MVSTLLPRLKYLLKASTGLYIHSPFVHDFCQSVLYSSMQYYAFDQIEQYRYLLTKDKTVVSGADPGKGSRVVSKNQTIAHYAKVASIAPKYGQLLFKLVVHYNCANMLELGTCLGVGTAYLGMANPNAKVLTIEGNRDLALKADSGLKTLGIRNANVINDLFDNVLPHLIDYMAPPDLVFIDGHHTFDATIRYFEKLLPFAGRGTIFIFDDINWSMDMAKAWKAIEEHLQTTITIDIGRMGIALVDPGLTKQEFVLRF